MTLASLNPLHTRISRSMCVAVVGVFFTGSLFAQGSADIKDTVVRNKEGLRMLLAAENTQPTLRIVLPGHALTDRSIEVVFPEHVTVRKPGDADVEHIYMWREGAQGEPPTWRREGQALEYEKTFEDGIHMLARATLKEDGVTFEYNFSNASNTAFDLVWAPTDPRLTGMFHDARLERTYVHHKDGWGLLAANTPGRLSMPLNEWLPARYHDSYTAPVPAKLVERRGDGITYYDNPVPVDEPVIATLSEDNKWVVASFSHATGNVWSNPELTCQHVDENSTLAPKGDAALEVKILIFRGSLDQVLGKVAAQRDSLN
jgi:hypothetical protein